ncbi:NAD-binding protein, partial [bacterium]|nr:NAD-binding protein [bacterium]
MSILIIGGGEIGRYLANQLIAEKKSVVIIEKDESVIDDIEESLDAKFILGNGAAPQVLKKAGLEEAEMVVAVTDSDEVNMLASIFAGIKAPLAKRIARIRATEFDIEGEKLKAALGIDLLINPEKEVANEILRLIRTSWASEIDSFMNDKVLLVEIKVNLDNVKY